MGLFAFFTSVQLEPDLGLPEEGHFLLSCKYEHSAIEGCYVKVTSLFIPSKHDSYCTATFYYLTTLKMFSAGWLGASYAFQL